MVWRRSVGDGPRPGQRRHELILPAYGLCRQTLSLQLADNLQLECFTISNCWFVPDLFGSRVSIYSRRSDYGVTDYSLPSASNLTRPTHKYFPHTQRSRPAA